jgi:CRP-like cAMP-binding protein
MKRAGDADTEFKLRTLKAAPFFSHTAEEDLAELARVAKLLAAQRGKPLAKPGSEGELIYLIQTGVAAELQADADEEEALLVALVGQGEATGLVSAMLRLGRNEAGAPLRRQLHCLSNVTALSLPAPDFFRVCRRSTDLSLALAETLAGEAADAARLFIQSVAASLEARLSAFFARVADLTSRRTGTRRRISGKSRNLPSRRCSASLVNTSIAHWRCGNVPASSSRTNPAK